MRLTQSGESLFVRIDKLTKDNSFLKGIPNNQIKEMILDITTYNTDKEIIVVIKKRDGFR